MVALMYQKEDKVLYTAPITDSNKSILWLFELDEEDKDKVIRRISPKGSVFS